MTSSKPQTRFDLVSFLRALKPLLFLIIPIVIIVVNRMFLAEPYPEIAKWIDYAAYGMCAIIGLWVFIRLFVFFKRVIYMWRHDREEMRKDPLFVIETKMRARLKEVHRKLKRIEKAPYDLPFYAVIGPNKNDVESLLNGSGVVFPKDLNKLSPTDKVDDYERWHIGNEAVFADITAFQNPAKELEWQIFLKTLARLRPAAPINGVLILVPMEQLKGKGARVGKDVETALQKNLQLMQEKLLEKFPVYVLVTNLEKMNGFNEFFGDASEAARDQIIGWSAPAGAGKKDQFETLPHDLTKTKAAIEQLMLQKMAEQKNLSNVDRIYIFAAELSSLIKKTADFVTRVFDPNVYLEPVPLRGFYLTGGNSAAAQLSAVDIPLGRQTVIGDGANMRVDSSTVIGEGVNVDALTRRVNWFTRDLFSKKLIPERGSIARPVWVIKRQRFLKVAAGAVFAFQLLLLGGLLVSEVGKTSNWRDESAEVIKRAHYLLGKQVYSKQDDILAQQILEDILRIQEELKRQGLFNSATSIGLGSEVSQNLTNLHSLVYQKYFLTPLMRKVEADLSGWDGINKPFQPFGAKLVEYLRWANPQYSGELGIDAFLNWEKDAVTTKNRAFMQRHFVQRHTDAIPRITDNNAVARISKALERINGATRVTIPLESGNRDRFPGESEWEWWQRLAGKLDGFSTTIQKLLQIKSPFIEESRGKDPNDQIYYATKMVAQLMSSVTELEAIMAEGQTKYPTWLPAMPDFFPDIKAAAVGWPPMLEAIEKCELRSEYAYEKVVAPLLQKEMAWVQTFMGLKNDQLTRLLDRTVEKHAELGSRQTEIFREIGDQYLTFLKSFNGYLTGFGELIKKSGALVSSATYYTGDELIKKLEAVKKELEEINKLEATVVATSSVLDGVLAEIEKDESAPDPQLKPKAGVKKNAAALGKDALKDAVSGIALKKEVLDKFLWRDISAWLKRWQKGLKSEKAYLASLYWMELFDWFKPFTKNQMKGGSYASILRMNLFMQKNAQAFTEEIEKFLDGWISSIPSEIREILAQDSAAEKEPGLKDFVVLYNQVTKFRDMYMPQLRQAAALFVSAVSGMEPDAQKTWRKLAEGADPELSWDALEAFSKFKEDYEIKEGVGLRNITGSLEEVQIALSKTLNGELGKKFDGAWSGVMKRLHAKDTHTKFPFVQNGPSASYDEAVNALGDLVELGVSLGVIQSEDGTAVDLSGQSQKILDRVVPTVRRSFLQRCAAYHKFLVGEGEPMPEVTVALIPGNIGKHYHWVRMFVGRLRYYDLSVYGNKEAQIDLATNLGGVKFMGLDVQKSPLAEQTVTKGELGLLQLSYLNGRSLDKNRTKWRIVSSLASASSDGEQVSFDLTLTFSKPLPPLPIIPGR